MNALNQFEVQVLLFIQEHIRFPAMDAIMSAVTLLGDAGIAAIAVTLFLLIWKKYRRVGATCAVSLLAEFILGNLVLKPLVARVRPYDVSEALTVLTHLPHDLSFPSGHTGSVFAVAAVMFCMMPRRWGIPALVAAILISVSRLYVGVHYPTDVLGGLILGLLTAWGARKLIGRIWPEGAECPLRRRGARKA